MGYLAVWKVLEEMILEFRKKGVSVPTEVMDDLKSAKTMIKILKADPSRGETMQKIEEYISNVESYLISEGQKNFGVEYVDKWLKKLDEASMRIPDLEEKETRFVPGLPREQRWIRVKPSAELPIEKLKMLAKESNLSYELQSDGCLLVYGKDESLKEFVKKMAKK
ncbi:MAG: DUF2096 family protein [Candidatus Bathycorpusculaceae bacterium]